MILAVTAITFVVFYLLQAAIRRALRRPAPTPELLATVRHNLGLDRPWYTQYFKFVRHIVTGDSTAGPASAIVRLERADRDKIIRRHRARSR